MLSRILDACYLLLAAIVLPMVVWKRCRTGKYRQGWSQKLWGTLPRRDNFQQTVIWLHAVSVGEVLQLRQVVERLRRCHADAELLITTTTETGFAVAREKFPDCKTAFFPLDFSWSVRTALQRVQPDLIVLVELELWPNFIREAHCREIPLVLINGRLSENSFRGYSRIRPLFASLLRRFAAIGVQSEEYRQRFLALGANAETTIVTGSIKFDGVVTARDNPRTHALQQWLGIEEGTPVFVAGSTQDPEESYALKAYESLLGTFPRLRLILVPRHPERGEELANLILRRGFSLARRSTAQQIAGPGGRPCVGLLDTVGELGACWGLANVAFVGGSFTNRGGQNMLEPAAYGAAVCFGPNTRNFRQTVELLHFHDAARTVHSAEELASFLHSMLIDSRSALEMGGRAQALVLSQQGATDRTVDLLSRALHKSEPIPLGRAA